MKAPFWNLIKLMTTETELIVTLLACKIVFNEY